MALLTLSDLGKRCDGKWLIWDVCLEIDVGEIVGIFGRSGSGKTALARVLAGIDATSTGSITFQDGEQDPRGRVSIGFSTPAAAPETTVYESLDVFASLWGVSRRRRSREIAYLLELLRLANVRSTPTAKLPTGALTRLEIARALVADAPLTVLDCLVDSLDPGVREKLWEHLLDLRRNQRKSFLVMTSSSKVAELCGRIAVMHEGRLSFIGKPDDFRRLAGDDLVVLGDMTNPALKNRIQERISVVIQEEDGFLSFRVANGDRIISDLLAEFGPDLSCAYLKRPTLDDALEVLTGGTATVMAGHVAEEG